MSKLTLHEIVKVISKRGKAIIGRPDTSGLPDTLVSLGLCEWSKSAYMRRHIYSLVPTDKWSDLMTNWLKANYKELRSDGSCTL